MEQQKEWIISTESIRKVNEQMIQKRTLEKLANMNFTGVINLRYTINGKEYTKEITEEEIDSAYGKALKKHIAQFHR